MMTPTPGTLFFIDATQASFVIYLSNNKGLMQICTHDGQYQPCNVRIQWFPDYWFNNMDAFIAVLA